MKNGAIEALRAVIEMPLVGERKKAFDAWQRTWTVEGDITVTFDAAEMAAMEPAARRAFRGAKLAHAADALVSDIQKDPTLLAVEGRANGTVEIARLSVALLRWREPGQVELQVKGDGTARLVLIEPHGDAPDGSEPPEK